MSKAASFIARRRRDTDAKHAVAVEDTQASPTPDATTADPTKLSAGPSPSERPNPRASSISTRRQVQAERINILYNTNQLGTLAEPVAGSILAWALRPTENPDLAALWLLLIWAAAVTRAILLYRYHRRLPGTQDAAQWGGLYAFSAGGTGLIWGAAALALWPGQSLGQQLTLLVVIAAVSAFQSGMMASLLRASNLYLGAVVLVLLSGMLWRSGLAHLVTASLIALYGGILVLVNRHMNLLLVDALRLRFELAAAGEAAQSASRAKSEFIANMSHELRTPLNAIIGFSEIMMGEMFGPLGSPRYRDYSADIYRSGSHLLEVINDILDLSKVESGKIDIQEEPVDLYWTIQTALRLVEQRAQQAGVTLLWDRPSQPMRIRGDQRALKQVMLNLLSNAVKFTPVGGEVRVNATVEPDGRPLIAVTDTGIGMARDELPRAMEPFVRIEGVLARQYEGTGLGLPLVKSLVELHGGRFELASAPGLGTTARAWLPADRLLSTVPSPDKFTVGEPIIAKP